MKTFMEEYGLASVMAACAMFLVVMATPVGGAINSGLQGATTSVENSGTNAEAKAAKSIKSLAGEEEEIPDTIFVGYNSQNHCLVFSHDENSEGYSACDIKYGDVQNFPFVECNAANLYSKYGKDSGVEHVFPHILPWDSVEYSSVNIENEIYPKDMSYWFADNINISNINLSNVNTINTKYMVRLFANSSNITTINYGNTFNKPSSLYGQMFGTVDTVSSAPLCNRPNWSDRDYLLVFNRVAPNNMTYIPIETVGKVNTLVSVKEYTGEVTFYDENLNITHTENGSKVFKGNGRFYNYHNTDKYFKLTKNDPYSRNLTFWLYSNNGHDPVNTDLD